MKPEIMPKEVEAAIIRWATFHKQDLPKLSWDSLMGCYYFVANGMFHGSGIRRTYSLLSMHA